MGRKRYSRKKLKKLLYDRCVFCGETNPAVLDAHRIVPGERGGKYWESNTIICCANCHRLAHSGEIVIDRKYPSTGRALTVVHCWVRGEEKWLPEGNRFSG